MMNREELWAKSMLIGKFETLGENLAISDALLSEFDKRFTPEAQEPVVYGIQNPPKFEELFEGVEFEDGVAYLQYQNDELAFIYTPKNMSPDCFYIPKQVKDQNYPIWWSHNATVWLTDIFSEIDTGGMN